MKNVYESTEKGDAQTLSGLLVLEAIPNEVRDQEDGSFGVWILDDAHYSQAMKVVSEYRELPGEPWTCRECGKTVNAVFDECWNCGTARS